MDDRRMTLEGHLGELRRRIIICVCFLAAFAVLLYYQTPEVIKYIVSRTNSSGAVLAFLSISEAFVSRLKLAFTLSAVILCPLFIYEFLSFVIPALKKEELRKLRKILAWVSSVFVSGCVFGCVILLPRLMGFLVGYGEKYMTGVLSVGMYIGFIIWFCLFIGFVFTAPLLMFLLGKARVLKSKTLKKGRKYVIAFIVAAVAAIVPVNDLLSFTVMALPLFLVYELGILLISRVERRSGRTA